MRADVTLSSIVTLRLAGPAVFSSSEAPGETDGNNVDFRLVIAGSKTAKRLFNFSFRPSVQISDINRPVIFLVTKSQANTPAIAVRNNRIGGNFWHGRGQISQPAAQLPRFIQPVFRAQMAAEVRLPV